MTYLVVLEPGPNNWSAWVPDLPVCFTTGQTLPELRSRIREAIDSHIEVLREDNEPVPTPSSLFEHVGEYLVLFQPQQGAWKSYAPDLPDCECTGPTLEAARELTLIRVAGLKNQSQRVPPPASIAEYVEVPEPVTAPRR